MQGNLKISVRNLWDEYHVMPGISTPLPVLEPHGSVSPVVPKQIPALSYKPKVWEDEVGSEIHSWMSISPTNIPSTSPLLCADGSFLFLM